jgi:hypothetical protein
MKGKKATNHTIDMHYVSKFYLKQFIDKDGNLHVLDLKKRSIRKSSPSGVLYEKYFYSPKVGEYDQFGQEIEEAFQKFETHARNDIRNFIANIKDNKNISEDEKYRISEIAAIFHLRTLAYRNQNKFMNNQLIDAIADMTKKSGHKEVTFEGQKLTLSDLEKEKEKLDRNNMNHIDVIFRQMGTYTNIFFNKNWKVYISSLPDSFITTDNPVIDKHNPNTHVLSNSAPLRKQYFIVSPEIVIETKLKEVQNKRVKRKRISAQDVEILNAKIADQAFSKLISCNPVFPSKVLDIHKKYEEDYISDLISKSRNFGNKEGNKVSGTF